MPEPKRNVSEERKNLYNLGMALMVIGFLLFLSTFVIGISGFFNMAGGSSFDFSGAQQRFQSHAYRGGAMAVCGFLGMVLMIAGGVCRSIGVGGLAGSGVVLDPEQAREDLEPFSRMSGGMLNDALDESGILEKLDGGDDDDPVIKIRCRSCRELNEEDAKFCKNCGQPM